MSHEKPPTRGRGMLWAIVALIIGLVAAPSLVSAVAPSDHRTVGRVDTCVLNSASSCTINHGFGEKPTAIQAINSGTAIVSIDTNLTTATSYTIKFAQHTGANWPTGTNARFYVTFSFGPLPPPDTTAPDTSITSGPPSSGNSSSASFAFTATEAGTFECKLDSGAFAACTSPKAYTGLSDGSHTFEVRAIDAAGNVDASPAAATWSVDTAAPDTTITSAPASGEDTSASFAFTSEAGASFECKLDAGAYAACTSPKAYSGLAVGSHTFSVRATDAVGNVDATPATHTWSVTAPPAPTGVKPEMGGTVWGDSDWPQWEAEMGPSEHRRTYDNSLPANFEASKAGSANDYEAGRESWWSYKPTLGTAGMSTAQIDALKAFLRTVPVGHEFVLTVWHEPEDQIADGLFTHSSYLASQRQAGLAVDQINAEKGANSKLRYASILMGYWTFDTRGYQSTQNWRGLTATDWANVDIIGYDPYKWNPGDPSMEAMMTRDNSGALTSTSESAMANARDWGKTIAFPEWGCTRTGVSDADRAAWITAAYNWAKSWNTANPNNRLSDMTYFHIDDFMTAADQRPSWEVIGYPLSEAALRNAMADSRS